MCLSPIYIKNKKSNLDLESDKVNMYVPCGRCLECQVQKKYDYLVSTLAETYSAVMTLFFTLTYNNANVPYIRKNGKDINNPYKDEFVFTFSKRDLQLFLKRLRFVLSEKYQVTFRYIITCEYGTKGTKRPHYHCLIFLDKKIDSHIFFSRGRNGEPPTGLLVDCWKLGFVYTSDTKNGVVDQSKFACEYVLKYVCKFLKNSWVNEVDEDLSKLNKRKLVHELDYCKRFGLSDIDVQMKLRNRVDLRNRVPFILKSMYYGSSMLKLPQFKFNDDLKITYYDPLHKKLVSRNLPCFLANRLFVNRTRTATDDYDLDVKLNKYGKYDIVKVRHFVYSSMKNPEFQKLMYGVIQNVFDEKLKDFQDIIKFSVDYSKTADYLQNYTPLTDKQYNSLIYCRDNIFDFTYYNLFNRGYSNFIKTDIKESFAIRSSAFDTRDSYCFSCVDCTGFEIFESCLEVIYNFKRIAKNLKYEDSLKKFIYRQKKKDFINP